MDGERIVTPLFAVQHIEPQREVKIYLSQIALSLNKSETEQPLLYHAGTVQRMTLTSIARLEKPPLLRHLSNAREGSVCEPLQGSER